MKRVPPNILLKLKLWQLFLLTSFDLRSMEILDENNDGFVLWSRLQVCEIISFLIISSSVIVSQKWEPYQGNGCSHVFNPIFSQLLNYKDRSMRHCEGKDSL